jgi:hypothetical protein
MDLEDVVDCPPLVLLTGAGTHGYLLAWRQHQHNSEWWAIVTYIHIQQTGHSPVGHRRVVEVHGRSVRPVEPPAAYAAVPRLVLDKDGTTRPWEPPPPAEP